MKAPGKCPCCEGKMQIETIKCKKCGTAITNNFEFSIFDRLNSEQTKFLLGFIGTEGNIKEMEKKFSISYPTVKSRLTLIKQALDLETVSQTDSVEIIDRLEAGEISAQEALKLLTDK